MGPRTDRCASNAPRAGGWRRWPRSSCSPWAPAPSCLPAPSGAAARTPFAARAAGRGLGENQHATNVQIHGGSGQGRSRSGPARRLARLGAAPGRARRAPRGAPQSPPSRPPRPRSRPPSLNRWPRRSRLPPRCRPARRRARPRARQRARVDAHPSSATSASHVEEMPSSGAAQGAPALGSRASCSACSWRLLALAPLARAGPYQAIQCAAHLGAGPGGFHFSRSSPDFHRVKACGSGDGLGVTHARSRTGAGRIRDLGGGTAGGHLLHRRQSPGARKARRRATDPGSCWRLGRARRTPSARHAGASTASNGEPAAGRTA